MRVLITGNSQAGCLKRALAAYPEVLKDIAEVSFHAIPGGNGPAFYVRNGLLVAPSFNPNHPPYAFPEKAKTEHIDTFDAIIVSALGFVDGGFKFPKPIPRQGVLFDYGPKENNISNQLLSKGCYEHIVASSLKQQRGVRFLSLLRENYQKPIILQPFPLISEAICEHAEWPLNKMYKDQIAANKFFNATRDRVIKSLCEDLSVELLAYPSDSWTETGFTPREYMNNLDCVHATVQYGKLVLEQISDTLKKLGT